MARPRTYFELNRLAGIAKKREDAREAAKLTTAPKTYKPDEPSTESAVRSIENDNIYVRMPISAKAFTALGTDMPAAGILAVDAAAVVAPASSLVEFKGNNSDVLRVRVHQLKATPTEKVTKWGTRVVDKIDSSFSFPFGVTSGANSLSNAKALFFTFMAGPGNKVLGTRKGSYAELVHGKKILTKYVKS